MGTWTKIAVLSLCCAAPLSALGESVFDFESVAAGTVLPFALSVNGLTANFGGGSAVCQSTGLSGDIFLALTGNALMQGFCQPGVSGPVTVSFSAPLSKLTFAVAVNGTDPVPVTVTYLRGGVAVGSQTIDLAVPSNSLSPEATVSYTGIFDAVTVSSAGLLAIDNLDAVPATPTIPTNPTTPTTPGN